MNNTDVNKPEMVNKQKFIDKACEVYRRNKHNERETELIKEERHIDIIKLKESELRKIISESIRKIIYNKNVS